MQIFDTVEVTFDNIDESKYKVHLNYDPNFIDDVEYFIMFEGEPSFSYGDYDGADEYDVAGRVIYLTGVGITQSLDGSYNFSTFCYQASIPIDDNGNIRLDIWDIVKANGKRQQSRLDDFKRRYCNDNYLYIVRMINIFKFKSNL